MNSPNEQKRLVLIGIRRKGEKGFKTKTDNNFSTSEGPMISKPPLVEEVHHPNASRIISILPKNPGLC